MIFPACALGSWDIPVPVLRYGVRPVLKYESDWLKLSLSIRMQMVRRIYLGTSKFQVGSGTNENPRRWRAIGWVRTIAKYHEGGFHGAIDAWALPTIGDAHVVGVAFVLPPLGARVWRWTVDRRRGALPRRS